MTTLLTAQDKAMLVNQALRQIDFSIYGVELEIIQAEAASNPDESQINEYNLKLTSYGAKRSALVQELDSLTE